MKSDPTPAVMEALQCDIDRATQWWMINHESPVPHNLIAAFARHRQTHAARVDRETVARIIAPDLFHDYPIERHRAASPLTVEAAQRPVLTKADAILKLTTPEAAGEESAPAYDLRHRFQMVVAHATGGGDMSIDRPVNDICVEITRFRNVIYQAGKEDAAKPTPPSSDDGAGAGKWGDDRLGQAYELVEAVRREWPNESGVHDGLTIVSREIENTDLEIGSLR